MVNLNIVSHFVCILIYLRLLSTYHKKFCCLDYESLGLEELKIIVF